MKVHRFAHGPSTTKAATRGTGLSTSAMGHVSGTKIPRTAGIGAKMATLNRLGQSSSPIGQQSGSKPTLRLGTTQSPQAAGGYATTTNAASAHRQRLFHGRSGSG